MRGPFVVALAAFALACNAILGIEAPMFDPTLGVDAASDAGDGSVGDARAPGALDASAVDAVADAAETGVVDAGDACAAVDPLGNDPQNCGACGRSCLGGACLGGACQPFDIARQQPIASELALSDTDVYWTVNDATTPLVGRAPKNGSAPCIGPAAACTVSVPASGPDAILVDTAGVFVGDTVNQRILRFDADLVAAPRTIVAAAGTPTSFASLGGRLYWSNRGLEFVRSAPIGGGSVAPLATATSGSPSPWGIATDGVALFVAASTAGSGSVTAGLYKLLPAGPCSGAGCVPLGATGDIPYAVAVSGGWVYWGTFGGKILRMDTAGGCMGATPCPQTIVSITQPVRGLVVSGASLYFTADDGALRKSDVTGCAAGGCTVLATNLGQTGPMVQDARAIYFARAVLGTPNTGAVTVVAK